MSKTYIQWGRQYWGNRSDTVMNMGTSMLHAVFGVVSEAGEVCDLYKKYMRGGAEPTRDQIIDECGDMLYYMARLLDDYGATFEEAFAKNQVKLDYRMAHGKNKEVEAQLQKKVTIDVDGGSVLVEGMKYA